MTSTTQPYHGIVLFGPPGCGKGTQGEKLGALPGYFHFSTGEMFRKLDPTTEIGGKIKKLIDTGTFAPEPLVLPLIKETLQRYVQDGVFDPAKQVLVLDGIPRTVEQVALIGELVAIAKVFHFSVPDEELERRLLTRGKDFGREDDQNLDKIKSRLAIYKEVQVPVLAEYAPNIVVELDGTKSVEEIYDLIIKELGNF